MTQGDSTHRTPLAAWPTRTATVVVLEGADAGKEASGERVGVGTADDNALVLSDRAVSRYHLEVGASEQGLRVSDVGSMNGTLFSGARIERAILPPGAVVRIGGTTLRVGEGAATTAPMFAAEHFGGLVGRSPTMRRLMADVERVAQSTASVLVHGESGVGKELVARALHDYGPRKGGPFEIVDCGAIVPTLVASELFGHERGAFTGADRTHVGAFERASGGTLFLDEIGELPIGVQANLLGALERRRFRRLGGRDDIVVDVRVVSATNRDLRATVNEGHFRHDLYYRIGTIALAVPALRERLEDVPLLVEHFVHELGHASDEIVTPEMMLSLRTHHWPGNVRELRNAVDAILAMGRLPQLGAATAPAPTQSGTLQKYRVAREAVLAQFEKAYLTSLVERCEGNVSRAAREAAMDRSYLIQLLARHGLGRE